LTAGSAEVVAVEAQKQPQALMIEQQSATINPSIYAAPVIQPLP